MIEFMDFAETEYESTQMKAELKLRLQILASNRWLLRNM